MEERAEEQSGALGIAIAAVWMSLAVAALTAVLNLKRGEITQAEFVFAIFVNGAMCVVPYKLQKRSNAARYVYLVLSCMGALLALANVIPMTPLDRMFAWLWLPVEVWTLYVMFLTPAAEEFQVIRA